MISPEEKKVKKKVHRIAWKKANPEKVKASKAQWYQARKKAFRAAYATWKNFQEENNANKTQ